MPNFFQYRLILPNIVRFNPKLPKFTQYRPICPNIAQFYPVYICQFCPIISEKGWCRIMTISVTTVTLTPQYLFSINIGQANTA